MLFQVAYLIINFLAILFVHFIDAGIASDFVMRNVDFAEGLTKDIPVISRVVSFMEQNNQTERAELVSLLYGFSWSSFVVLFLISISVFFVQIYRLDSGERDGVIARYWATQRTLRKRAAAAGRRAQFVFKTQFWIALLVAIFFFYIAFQGDYNFENPGVFNNRVYRRDIDIFRVPVALFFFWLFAYVLINRLFFGFFKTKFTPNDR